MLGIWVGLWKKGAQWLQTLPRSLVVTILLQTAIQLDLSGYFVSPRLGWVLGTTISFLACLYFSFKKINLNLVTVFLLMETCSWEPLAQVVWCLSRSTVSLTPQTVSGTASRALQAVSDEGASLRLCLWLPVSGTAINPWILLSLILWNSLLSQSTWKEENFFSLI